MHTLPALLCFLMAWYQSMVRRAANKSKNVMQNQIHIFDHAYKNIFSPYKSTAYATNKYEPRASLSPQETDHV